MEEKIFQKVIGLLKRAKIPYMLTGGLAVTIWGRPRSTWDFDIVINVKEKDKYRILRIFKKDFYISEEELDLAFSKTFSFNIIDYQSIAKIDFYLAKENEYEKLCFRRGVKKKILGMNIEVISPEDLILIKLQWYKKSDSTRHLEDAESILKTTKIDLEYIRNWAKRQKTSKILEDLFKKTKAVGYLF